MSTTKRLLPEPATISKSPSLSKSLIIGELEDGNSFAWAYEPILYRVLKYTPGCYIEPHIDRAWDGSETDHSLIIQMNPTDEFKGGIPTVADKEYRIEQGDALIYEYGERHGVSEVTNGVRYAFNVRMKKKHK